MYVYLKVKPTEYLEGIVYKLQDLCLSTVLKDGSIVTLSETKGMFSTMYTFIYYGSVVLSGEPHR